MRPQGLKKLRSVFFERDNDGIGKRKEVKLTGDLWSGHTNTSYPPSRSVIISNICMEYEENYGSLNATEYKKKQETLIQIWKDITIPSKEWGKHNPIT